MVDQAGATKAKAEKVTPPSPPRIIENKASGASFERIGYLGEGGFARVWEVQDNKRRKRAVKVVYKPNIKTKKNKTKLWAEIKLHQMMQHPHIVRFDDCFEDEDNVYMMLELCENGNLMDLLRKRKRYTEPEARLILVQLIAACQYMHQTNVIHRDLKLGNLFFDKEMNVKVGDFGLAALIENPGDRKKTICGTPNYIAPEVLFDQANGHSFEVDVWSVGVILYTLLIGKPPFQTKDINAIYKRIRDNRYEFPADKEISRSAQQLIMAILNPNPQERPTLDVILQHRWFHDGPFPPYVPVSAFEIAPDYTRLTTAQWRRNFERACQVSKIGVNRSIATTASRRDDLGPSIIQQDKDFRYAVQPDSPVGALIQSARQPLVQAPSQIKEPTLLRKLSAAGAQSTLSPVRRAAARYCSSGAPASGPSSAARQMAPVGEEEEDGEDEGAVRYNDGRGHTAREDIDGLERSQELATQKARIVSGMAGLQIPANGFAGSETDSAAEGADGRYERQRAQKAEHDGFTASTRSPRRPLGTTTGYANQSAPTRRYGSPVKYSIKGKEKDVAVGKHHVPPPTSRRPGRVSGLFQIIGDAWVEAFAATETPEGYLAREEILNAKPPSVFVVSWLDYCQKYGMGFAMCDGTVSVHFNDSSSIAWSPNKQYFDYLLSNTATGQFERSNHPISTPPDEVINKVFLLKHFEKYIKQRLYGSQDYLREDKDMTTGMVFVKRYLRMKHVIIFRLSNGVLQVLLELMTQFNFFDHTKIIASREGQVISFIDKQYQLHTWSLEDLLYDSKNPGEDRAYARRVERVVYKLQYCKDVLVKIRTHGLSAAAAAESAGNTEEFGADSKSSRYAVQKNGVNGASAVAAAAIAETRHRLEQRDVRAIR